MTRKLGIIGDVNPIEYGGGYVLGGVPDVGGPWVEYVHGLDETHPKAWDVDLDDRAQTDTIKVEVYRVDLGTNAREFLRDHDWVNWDDVASTCGQDPETYSEAAELDTAQKRALAVWDAAGHYGWHEFDQYPLQLTLTELIERWSKY